MNCKSSKRCSKCDIEKPATTEFFRSQSGGRLGLKARCRECERKAVSEYKARNDVALKARRKELRLSSIEQRRANERERAAKRRKLNKERMYETNREWKKRNPEKVLSINREYLRMKRRDPEFRITQAVRSRVYASVKRGGKQWRKTFDLLDYSPEELRSHIERQFRDGMSWDNYGDWHIDHVVPIASFNIKAPTDREFKACWSLANLRPIWAGENLKKNKARTHLV